jgi:hypothetical protein
MVDDDEQLIVDPTLTPEQLGGARLLLSWSRDRLSGASGVPLHFITKYEQLGHIGRLFSRERNFDALEEIRAAFEAAGVIFTAGRNPGVALKQRKTLLSGGEV